MAMAWMLDGRAVPAATFDAFLSNLDVAAKPSYTAPVENPDGSYGGTEVAFAARHRTTGDAFLLVETHDGGGRRRSLLPVATPTAHPPSQPLQVQAARSLVRTTIDDARFPELQVPVGQIGIRGRLVRRGADPRLVIAEGSTTALLIVFRLDEPPIGKGPPWELEIQSTEPNGASRVQRLTLDEPPIGGNFVRVTPDSTLRTLPGQIYRGAFWVDVTALLPIGDPWMRSAAMIRYGSVGTVVPVEPR